MQLLRVFGALCAVATAVSGRPLREGDQVGPTSQRIDSLQVPKPRGDFLEVPRLRSSLDFARQISHRTEPISSGIMRFGVELEQIVKIGKNSAKPFQHVKQIYLEERKKEVEFPFLLYKAAREEFIASFVDLYNKWNPAADVEFIKAFPTHYQKYKMYNGASEGKVSKKGKWTVVLDGSLHVDTKEPTFGIEIVSPILYIGSSSDWYAPARYQLDLMFYFLKHKAGLELVRSNSASTHVHISPIGSKLEWTLQRVQSVSMSSLYFEPAIRAMLPKDRWNNQYAPEYRNYHWKDHWAVDGFAERQHPELSNTPSVLLTIMRKIKGLKTIANVVAYMNPGDPSIVNDTPSRYWGWNLDNLVKFEGEKKSVKGSIEFRRGAQSMNADDAMLYVEIASAMGLAACLHGDAEYISRSFGINPQDFSKFVYHEWPQSPKSDNLPEERLAWYQLDAYQKGFRWPQLDRALGQLGSVDVTNVAVNYDTPLTSQQTGTLPTGRTDNSPTEENMLSTSGLDEEGLRELEQYTRENEMAMELALKDIIASLL